MSADCLSDIDWSGLKIFPEPYEWEPPFRDRAQADYRLNLMLSQREDRYESLRNFFNDNGLTLSTSTKDLNKVSRFFGCNIPGTFESDIEDLRWRELITDLGLFLGDHIISVINTRPLRWHNRNHALKGGTPRFSPVLMGFLDRGQFVDTMYHFGMISLSKRYNFSQDQDIISTIITYAKTLSGAK